MPYVVRKEGDKFCVFNEDTGDKKACHDTEKEAEDQVKLLHAVENDPGWAESHE